jgi:hypothetical protein
MIKNRAFSDFTDVYQTWLSLNLDWYPLCLMALCFHIRHQVYRQRHFAGLDLCALTSRRTIPLIAVLIGTPSYLIV